MQAGSGIGRHPLKTCWPHRGLQSRALGFTYLGVLAAIALMGVALLAVSEVWVTTANRQKMEQLEWAGNQYAQAIGSYYYANVGSVRYYPKTLDDLLEDKRYLAIKRHLRELYPNPYTEKVDWKLIDAPNGGFMGISALINMPSGQTTKSFIFTPAETAPFSAVK